MNSVVALPRQECGCSQDGDIVQSGYGNTIAEAARDHVTGAILTMSFKQGWDPTSRMTGHQGEGKLDSKPGQVGFVSLGRQLA